MIEDTPNPAPAAAPEARRGLEVVTLGCRLNLVESEAMRAHATVAGLDDAVIINTCAVTAEAVRTAARTIRKLRRERPTARLIVTGCAAQIEPDRFAAMLEVDHVVGNAEKTRPETFRSLSTSDTERVVVDDIMSVRETAGHLIDGFTGRARAFVQVQNGCDHRCTFCIIPFGRGPSRSVPAGVVVDQVRRLVERGTREIVLTGVDMTSYGADLPGSQTLGRLVRQVLSLVPELSRLRLSSIDQIEADSDLLRALAEEERLMPHLHLSLQAGNDMILKRMKRRHSRADAVAFAQKARRLRSDIVLGADLIAGFPTETESMFADTLALADDCGLTWLHVFPYSPRPGTPAARMPQVARPVIAKRAERLRVVAARRVDTHLAALVGREESVLMEGGGVGRTRGFAEVRMAEPVGAIVRARLVAVRDGQLIGERIA